jgi:hypothetical protein
VAANGGRYDPVTGEWVDKGPTFLRCSIGDQAAHNVAESLTKDFDASGAALAGR